MRHLLEKLGCCSQRGGDGCGGGGAGWWCWWSLVNRDGKAGGQLAFTGGQSACPLHFCPWGEDGRVAGRSLVCCWTCPQSALNTLCGWLRRLLFGCWTARHGPSRKPRDPGRGESSLMLPSAESKLIASAGWRPSRCLNTSVMHPRAKWERGGHPLVQ